jgi:hypothetical protein
MDKLSSNMYTFTYLGKKMPLDYSEICKEDKFQDKIRNRDENPTRYFLILSDFLEHSYKGDLPKSPARLAKKFGYPDYIQALLYMHEEGYRNIYKDQFDDFFKNKPKREQERLFQASDWGARSVYQFQQDVYAGNIIEDMISYHTKNILSPNEAASGRGSNGISTKCDFIFRNPSRVDRPDRLEVPIELKTKWKTMLNPVEEVKMRGSINTLMNTGGMVLVVYVRLNKAVLLDPVGKTYDITRGYTGGGKECDIIKYDKRQLIDFKFWDKEDVTKMMHMIYDYYKERETK